MCERDYIATDWLCEDKINCGKDINSIVTSWSVFVFIWMSWFAQVADTLGSYTELAGGLVSIIAKVDYIYFVKDNKF